MGRILVTGGTGFLGKHLLAMLSRRGEKVRVLSRAATPELDELGVEVIAGSLLDEEVLAKACKGVERIYHLAGLVSRDPDAAGEMYRLHVDGTRLLLDTAHAAKVKRVVVASTSGTIAVSKREEEISTEESPFRYELVRDWPYYLSKIYQEKLALAFEGMDVLCINPSILFGPGDTRLSSSGDVLKFLKREIPVVPSGGINFVDARDAAAGAILAMEHGKAKSRYLLGGPNWTMQEFFLRLGRASGVRPPAARIPDAAARLGARIVDGLYRLGGPERRAPVDPVSVEMAQHFWYCDSTRARTELGWEPRDPMETLDDTVAFLRERFLGGAPRPEKAPSFLETLVTRMGDEPAAPAPKQRRERRTRP
ncbi:NAD-dependent epimerase/dehydratase family protein [Vulgatibacter sp.]|uniref:NAD-dependent epimerase/dehydratase family protein n=1 Tax=Vulgatibacter sp. TaxID=1971226 RepID=UPI0035675F32